jgi:hypothetical protein
MTALLNMGISMLFLLLWIVVGFFALRWIAQRFFTERYRSDVFALAVVVAFAAGVLGPFEHRGAPAPAAPAVAPVAANVPPAQPPHDVQAACKAVRSLSGTAMGSVDVVGIANDGKVAQQPNGFALARGASLGVVGWVGDAANKTPATGACLMIDGAVRPDAMVVYGNLRPDVATAYNTQAMAPTGYMLTLPAKSLKAGTHAVSVASVTANGAAALSTSVNVRVP